MKTISKKYLVDENNNKVAVQIGIEDYEKLERLFEDYALGKILEESENDELLELKDAKEYYENLKSKK